MLFNNSNILPYIESILSERERHLKEDEFICLKDFLLSTISISVQFLIIILCKLNLIRFNFKKISFFEERESSENLEFQINF